MPTRTRVKSLLVLLTPRVGGVFVLFCCSPDWSRAVNRAVINYNYYFLHSFTGICPFSIRFCLRVPALNAFHISFVDAVLSSDDITQMGQEDFGNENGSDDDDVNTNGLGPSLSSFQGFGEPRQAFVFSATLTLPDEDRKLVRNCTGCCMRCNCVQNAFIGNNTNEDFAFMRTSKSAELFMTSLNSYSYVSTEYNARFLFSHSRWSSIESN